MGQARPVAHFSLSQAWWLGLGLPALQGGSSVRGQNRLCPADRSSNHEAPHIPRSGGRASRSPFPLRGPSSPPSPCASTHAPPAGCILIERPALHHLCPRVPSTHR